MASNQVRAEPMGCRDSDIDIDVDEEPVMQVCEVLGELWGCGSDCYSNVLNLFEAKAVPVSLRSQSELAKEFVSGVVG